MRALIPLIAGSILFTGCQYRAPVCEKTGLELDDRLIGEWVLISTAGKKIPTQARAVRMVVGDFDGEQYFIRCSERDRSMESDPATSCHSCDLRGYPIKIGGTTALQIECLERSGKGFITSERPRFQVLRYRIEKDVLELSMLNASLVPPLLRSSRQLEQRVRQHAGNPKLFRVFQRFRKVGQNTGSSTNKPEATTTRKRDADSGNEELAGELDRMLEPFRKGNRGRLPDTFRVRIRLAGYLARLRPFEAYEFSPTQVCRLRRIRGKDEKGRFVYLRDKKTNDYVFEVAARKPFKRAADLCRTLSALGYADLVRQRRRTGGRNLNNLFVMKGAGLPPAGSTSIQVSFGGNKLEIGECCLFAGFPTSDHSIRYAALYHTLRRLARSEMGLAASDWRDAIESEKSTKERSAKPAREGAAKTRQAVHDDEF